MKNWYGVKMVLINIYKMQFYRLFVNSLVHFFIFSSFLLSGCSNIFVGYEEEFAKYNAAYFQNECDSTFLEEKLASENDILLWSELGGSFKRKCKDYIASNFYLDQAEEEYKESVDLESMGGKTVRIIGENFTNENIASYRGSIFESIMVNTYKGLNFMSLGRPDLARVEWNRALDRQRRASLTYRSQIQKVQRDLEKEAKKDDIQHIDRKSVENAVYKKYSQGMFRNFQAYPDFLNPFTTYMAGLFFLSENDVQKAWNLLRDCVAMNPKNLQFRRDFQLVEDLARGKKTKNYIWLLYENGMIAQKDEFRFDLPLSLSKDKSVLVSMSFPILKEQPASYPFLLLNGQKTELVADMDRVAKTEFHINLPIIITKAVARTIIKTVMQAQLGEKNELLNLGFGMFNVLTNRSDIRSWQSLPKNFQSVCIENTGRYCILQTHSGKVLKKLQIPVDKNAFIFLSSSVPEHFVVHTILF